MLEYNDRVTNQLKVCVWCRPSRVCVEECVWCIYLCDSSSSKKEEKKYSTNQPFSSSFAGSEQTFYSFFFGRRSAVAARTHTHPAQHDGNGRSRGWVAHVHAGGQSSTTRYSNRCKRLARVFKLPRHRVPLQLGTLGLQCNAVDQGLCSNDSRGQLMLFVF